MTTDTPQNKPSLRLKIRIKINKLNTILSNLTRMQKALVVLSVGVFLYLLNGLTPLTFIWPVIMAYQLYYQVQTEPVINQYHDDIFALLTLNNNRLIVSEDELNIADISTVVIDQINLTTDHALLQNNFSEFKSKQHVGLLHFAFNRGGKLLYYFPTEQVTELTEFFQRHLPNTKIIK